MDNTLYENFLAHIGIKYKSGRYEYGSGENPYQHDPHHVLKRARELKDAGMDEKTIANELGLTTTTLRANRQRHQAHHDTKQNKKKRDVKYGYW